MLNSYITVEITPRVQLFALKTITYLCCSCKLKLDRIYRGRGQILAWTPSVKLINSISPIFTATVAFLLSVCFNSGGNLLPTTSNHFGA